MARPTPPGKRTRISVLDAVVMIVVVIGGVLAIIRYNWLAISRLAHSLPNVNSQIVGEWKSTRGPEHLVFRTDKTVSMTVATNLAQDSAAPAAPETGSPAPAAPETNGPAPVTGKYELAQGGKVVIQLMGGKKYTTTISPGNQNRFDLIDSATEAVTTFERVPSAFQTLHRSLRPNRLAARPEPRRGAPCYPMSLYRAAQPAEISAVVSNREKSGQRPNRLADEPVNGEPVSGCKFPASREFAGNFSEFEPNQAKSVGLRR